MTGDDLDRLEALCAAATPGPNVVMGPASDDPEEYWIQFGAAGWRKDSTIMSRADAEYTAAARTAVPELVRRVRELEAEVRDLRENTP